MSDAVCVLRDRSRGSNTYPIKAVCEDTERGYNSSLIDMT